MESCRVGGHKIEMAISIQVRQENRRKLIVRPLKCCAERRKGTIPVTLQNLGETIAMANCDIEVVIWIDAPHGERYGKTISSFIAHRCLEGAVTVSKKNTDSARLEYIGTLKVVTFVHHQ